MEVVTNDNDDDDDGNLLKLLRENGHSVLCSCITTLLNTPKKVIVLRSVLPGQYFHFGLKKCLMRSNYSFLITEPLVEIAINIDGV